MSQRRFHRYGWLFVCLFCFTLFMLGRNLFVAHAEPAAGPAVSYNSQFNLIYIGSDVGAGTAAGALAILVPTDATRSEEVSAAPILMGGVDHAAHLALLTRDGGGPWTS